MKVKYVLIMCCLAMGGCSDSRNNSRLRVVSPGQQSDAVRLWVSNRSMDSKGKRPRILEAKVSFDGVESEAKPRIGVANGKHGWSESAEFSGSDIATAAQIVATVQSNGQAYTVTQDWSRMRIPGDWAPGRSSITRREDQGKGKGK